MSFTLFLRAASGYDYSGEWQFIGKPILREAFQEEVEARAAYETFLAGLSYQATMHNTAVRLSVVQDAYTAGEKEILSKLYAGENVRFYYGAYTCENPRRRYIDQILADVTYYGAMFPSAGITTQAIAATIDELEHLLGKEFETYELLT